jgi:Uma2 family endonuclease
MSTTALMTFAEFEQLPDAPGKRELIDGELSHMPPPELNHSRISKRIYDLLAEKAEKSRVYGDHTGYRIGDGWIEPDVSYIFPKQAEDDKYFAGSPMIAVEILSPGEEIDRKLTLYFADGAREVWVIDPKHRALTVYARENDHVIRTAVEQVYNSAAAGLALALPEIFG